LAARVQRAGLGLRILPAWAGFRPNANPLRRGAIEAEAVEMRVRLVAVENRKWWTLAAVSFGLFMIMLDNTVVNVALPSIRKDLGMSLSELEWVSMPMP
jgi:hypothetical protein